MDHQIGDIVISSAGRDKDLRLCVVGIGDGGIYVCDGKERRLEKPKFKNPKHVTATGCRIDIDSDLRSDKALRRALKTKCSNNSAGRL